MPIERRAISVSQLSELLGIEPERFICVKNLSSTGLEVWLEDEMQTTGSCPPLSDNTSRKGPKSGGKR